MSSPTRYGYSLGPPLGCGVQSISSIWITGESSKRRRLFCPGAFCLMDGISA